MALQRIKKCKILWLDPFEETREIGREILQNIDKDDLNITLLDFDHTDPLRFLPKLSYHHAFCHDRQIINADFLKSLHQHDISYLSLSINHGLVKLLYPDPDLSGSEKYYTFTKGFYPAHVTNMSDDNWHQSHDLSYGSIACYQKA